jgi:DNA modification methylase
MFFRELKSNSMTLWIKKFLPSRKRIRRWLSPRILYFFKRSLAPISNKYGMNRGEPIDRYYINKFIEQNSESIHGHCLEIRDDRYLGKYKDKINQLDILDIDESNTESNIFGDLRNLKNIQDETYDCLVITQTFQYIDDLDSAILECWRILKKGGSLLITAPFMARIDPHSGATGDFWRFTTASLKHLISKKFQDIEVNSFGNLLVGTGYWIGQAEQEFSKEELDYNDPNFPIIITARATK